MFTQQYVLESLRRSREDEATRFACEAQARRSVQATGHRKIRTAAALRLPRLVRLRSAR